MALQVLAWIGVLFFLLLLVILLPPLLRCVLCYWSDNAERTCVADFLVEVGEPDLADAIRKGKHRKRELYRHARQRFRRA